MLIKFSNNPYKQFVGIAYHNRVNIFLFTLIAVVAYAQDIFLKAIGMVVIELPVVPVTILGGALAIFLGFRNNSAYDRWWEARKIWGAIVNDSRTFGMMITSFSSSYFSDGEVPEGEIKQWQKRVIHRHIAWIYGLKMELRGISYLENLRPYIAPEEVERIKHCHSKTTQILHLQGQELQKAFEQKIIEDFRHMELANMLKAFYDSKGKAERIKKTVFPYYYNYFTSVFLWLFIICLPFSLVSQMNWVMIPMCVAISFVFKILEKSGAITEDPFEGRAADIPISAITRTIEIDLLEMIGSDSVPKPVETKITDWGAEYLD